MFADFGFDARADFVEVRHGDTKSRGDLFARSLLDFDLPEDLPMVFGIAIFEDLDDAIQEIAAIFVVLKLGRRIDGAWVGIAGVFVELLFTALFSQPIEIAIAIDRFQPASKAAIRIVAEVLHLLHDLDEDILQEVDGVGFLQPEFLSCEARQQWCVEIDKALPIAFVGLIGSQLFQECRWSCVHVVDSCGGSFRLPKF